MSPLKLAQLIENAVGELEDAGWSCLALDRALQCATFPIWRVTDAFVNTIEPGLPDAPDPFGEFDEWADQQKARSIWLTLLAELAERGELTLEGLK